MLTKPQKKLRGSDDFLDAGPARCRTRVENSMLPLEDGKIVKIPRIRGVESRCSLAHRACANQHVNPLFVPSSKPHFCPWSTPRYVGENVTWCFQFRALCTTLETGKSKMNLIESSKRQCDGSPKKTVNTYPQGNKAEPFHNSTTPPQDPCQPEAGPRWHDPIFQLLHIDVGLRSYDAESDTNSGRPGAKRATSSFNLEFRL